MFTQLQIQTRTGCNLKCKMCPNSYMTQPKKTMTKKLFNKIIDELAEIKYNGRVSLYLMNEPFLDDRLFDLVKIVRDKLPENRINISTNGVIPKVKDVHDLLEIGLSDCDVSCYTKAIFKKWEEAGVNHIDMINYVYDYNNRGGNIDIGPKKPALARCERPFIQMYINAFGQAILCCSDYKFEVVMGDVNKQTLMEIWHGKKYIEYREKLSNHKREGLKLCEVCNYP